MPLPRLALALVFALVVPLCAAHGTQAAVADTVRVALMVAGDSAYLGPSSSTNITVIVPSNRELRVLIDCKPPTSCKKVSIESQMLGLNTPASDAVFTAVVAAGLQRASFEQKVMYDGKPVKNNLAFVIGAPIGGTPTVRAEAVVASLSNACRYDGILGNASDSVFIISPFGARLRSPKRRSSTEDPIYVQIAAPEGVKHLLTARAGSEIAKGEVSVIYGAGTGMFKEQSAGEKEVPPCVLTETAALGPFSAPKAVVEIYAFDGKPETRIGKFEVPVREMYTGSFALGGLATNVRSPGFAKIFNGTDTVVTRRDDGRRLVFAATYTHFWTRRDLQAGPDLWYKYLIPTPTIGVVLNDVANNALWGAAFELRPGFSLLVAGHSARVKQLDGTSGAVVGQPYANRAAEIPTTQRWTTKLSFGVLVDAKATGLLLKSLLPGIGK
jgi:hypothetical protein